MLKERDGKNRIAYLDAAKGIGMIAIIFGHMGIDIVERIVFTFHVPLFFVISGYLYHHSKDIRKRMRHLLLPYSFTSLILLILTDIRELFKIILGKAIPSDLYKNTYSYLLSFLYGSGTRINDFVIEIKPIGAIWFLVALFIVIVFMDWVKNHFKKYYMQISLSLLWFMISLVSSSYVWLPLSIQSAGVGVVYFWGGQILKKIDKKTYKGLDIVAGIALWGLAIYFSIYNKPMSIAGGYLPNCIVDIIGAFGACYIILYFTKCVEYKIGKNKSKIWIWLCNIGKYSTFVLCVHLIEIRIIPWHIMYCIGGAAPIFILAIKLIIATCTCEIVKRIKCHFYMNKYRRDS